MKPGNAVTAFPLIGQAIVSQRGGGFLGDPE
jgi:hypothetical protein